MLELTNPNNSGYLLDMSTGSLLADVSQPQPLPLASSTLAPVRLVTQPVVNDEIISLKKGKPKTSDRVVGHRYTTTTSDLNKVLNDSTFSNTSFSKYKIPSQTSDPNHPSFYSLPPYLTTYVFTL